MTSLQKLIKGHFISNQPTPLVLHSIWAVTSSPWFFAAYSGDTTLVHRDWNQPWNRDPFERVLIQWNVGMSCHGVWCRWRIWSLPFTMYPYKWPHQWVTEVITPVSRVITLLKTGRGPPWFPSLPTWCNANQPKVPLVLRSPRWWSTGHFCWSTWPDFRSVKWWLWLLLFLLFLLCWWCWAVGLAWLVSSQGCHFSQDRGSWNIKIQPLNHVILRRTNHWRLPYIC